MLTLMKGQILESSIEYLQNVSRSIWYFEESLISLNFDPESQKYKTLVTRVETATIFRENKRFVKNFVKGLFLLPVYIILLGMPFAYPFFLMGTHFSFLEYFFIYTLFILITLLNSLMMAFALRYYQNFEIRIGLTGVSVLSFGSLVALCLPLYACSGMPETVLKASLVSSFLAVYCITGLFVLSRLFGEFLVDFVFYSKKITITKALILDSAYKIARAKWNECIDNGYYRKEAMIEIERLAQLIESDMASHILPGDRAISKWKTELLLAKANGIRRFKQELINPGVNSGHELEVKFNEVFKNILGNNWKAIPEDWDMLKGIQKKSFIQRMRSFVVAVIPLTTVLCIKYFAPTALNESYIQIGMIVSGLWLIVSALMWLDPNLGDKLTTIKSMKSMFRGGNNED